MPRPPSPRSRIGERALQRRDDRVRRHRIHHVHAAARQQRRVELERRVLGRRADEHDDALLDVRQERILLHLVEAVHLVDEQHRADALREIGRRLGERLAHVGQAGQHGRDRAELRVGVAGEQQRQRRLAAARRTPQDHRMHVARFDRAAQRRVRREQAMLADDLVERARPHALGERLQPSGSANSEAVGWCRLAARHRCIICQPHRPGPEWPASNTGIASARDAPAIAEIYAPYVRDTIISFETEAPDAAEIGRAHRAHRRAVSMAGGARRRRVVGYAYACENRSRARVSLERRCGRLPATHRRSARASGARCIGACLRCCVRRVTSMRSPASRCRMRRASALHEAMGFALIGVYRNVGYKLGRVARRRLVAACIARAAAASARADRDEC